MSYPLKNQNSSRNLSQDACALNLNTVLSELNTTHSGLSQKEAETKIVMRKKYFYKYL
jgi:hypothetical protein